MQTILLDVTHPSRTQGRIEGFRFLWAYYASGYRSDKHCQPCLRGRRVSEFATNTASVGTTITLDRMDRYPYVYVCGVAAGPIRERGPHNLHLPMRYAEGEVAELSSYNGYRFRALNAAIVPIPALPDDWNGLERDHARCKNFQFAVAMFGYPSAPRRTGNTSTAG